jgi:rare lipoprotein A
VLDSSEGFEQRGIASWYGTKFHGRPTSSGEVYNMHAMTAAHKTLPIPVYVHVKNLDNGRSAVVRVNDRGPFIDGRIIDLSYAAAKKLGVDGPGTAKVEISVLKRGESKPTSVVRRVPVPVDIEPEASLFIQMGSFSSHLNANNLVQSLISANESSAKISRLQTDDGLFYRVRVGRVVLPGARRAAVRYRRSQCNPGAAARQGISDGAYRGTGRCRITGTICRLSLVSNRRDRYNRVSFANPSRSIYMI